MNEDRYGACLFAPEAGEEIIANEGTAFSEPFFAEAKKTLLALTSLPFSPNAFVFPLNYQEDLVQADRRAHFDLREWILAAVSTDAGGSTRNILLVHRRCHQEGYVIDLARKVAVVSFYRGFAIKESPESPLLPGEDFLLSIGFEEPSSVALKAETPLYFNSSEDGIPSFVPRPFFEAGGKKRILNLGSGEDPETDVEEDEGGEIHIEVEKAAFEAGGNKKPRNLGFSSSRRIDEPEGDGSVSNIEVARPLFEARGNKKPRNLNALPDRPKHVVVSSQPQPSPRQEEKILFEKPAFEASGKKEITHFDPVLGKESRNWTSIDIYKLRPDVFHRERSLIADPRDPVQSAFCLRVKEKLRLIKAIPFSDQLVFVPALLPDDDPHLRAAYRFEADKWDLLSLTVDFEDDPLLVLLSNKVEPSFCLVVSVRKDPLLEVLSLRGVALDDRALPYLSFEQIRKVVFVGK